MPNYFNLDWEVAGERQIARRFAHLAIAITNFRKPLARMARDVIYPEIKNQFGSEGDPDWSALSKRYAAWKQRHHPGKPKLVITGKLRASLTGRKATGSIYQLTKEQLVIGTSLKTPDGDWNLGRIHQEGAPRASIPARPMMRLRASAQTQAVQIFADWLYQEGRRAEVGL